ncbi:aminotransferase class I/II-fold pyridoxal phosphate-dependent enzyme [Geothrix sp. 21YS21S-2]|uniref:aminotransferase class I/II-fold pyridoxal phosphate-dependent enzyme n=1 Tax=Geothrix sp. 21YS21S-2 TaxID=3068893 RepID=UPI0027B8E3AB|nr:aminotransferase class I/II-fold pyridoxal phosphate-dependent enzyme [Geothrix sp. 21YS21S-2]
MAKPSEYAIQSWLFEVALGNFDIDLGESGIQCRHLEELRQAPTQALDYAPDRGQATLREEVALLYSVDPSQVLITHGAQEGLFLFYCSLLGSGDHVVTTMPGWQQSWEIPRWLGADISTLRFGRDQGFRFDLAQLRRSIRRNTNLLVLNFPNNPIGCDLTEEEWKEVGALAEEHGLSVMNDEEYASNYAKSIIHRMPRASAVSGLSKIYGFPGLRIGWLISDSATIQAATNMKRYTTVCNASLCEQLGLQVLKKRAMFLETYQTLNREGLAILKDWLVDHPNLRLSVPRGTPFAYLTVPPSVDSACLARRLLYEQRTLVMPGEVFMDEHALRLTFGRSAAILRRGLQALARVL